MRVVVKFFEYHIHLENSHPRKKSFVILTLIARLYFNSKISHLSDDISPFVDGYMLENWFIEVFNLYISDDKPLNR